MGAHIGCYRCSAGLSGGRAGSDFQGVGPQALGQDDAAGQEILKDNTGTSGSNVYNKYTISATRLKQALTAVSSDGKVGIWIVTDGDLQVATDGELQAGTFKAEIDILNVTTEAHHKLFVNPTYIVFESSTPTADYGTLFDRRR